MPCHIDWPDLHKQNEKRYTLTVEVQKLQKLMPVSPNWHSHTEVALIARHKTNLNGNVGHSEIKDRDAET